MAFSQCMGGLHGSVGRERCSANAETMGSNPVEVPKFFLVICNCLNCNYHCDDHIFIFNLYFRSSDHLQKEHSKAKHTCTSVLSSCRALWPTWLYMYFRVFIIQELLIQQRYHRKTFFQINILTSTPRVRVFERKSQSIVDSSHIYFGRIHIIPVTLLTKEFIYKVFNLFIEIIYFTVSDLLKSPG